MMKKLLLFSLFAAVLSACAADKKPIISTTIDYLDYVFFDERTLGKSYYPLEIYEQRIKEMAEGGIKKIYLRVNVCGTTHYPSKVSALYGENDAFHWESQHKDGALRLIETYKHYNPLTETIRLGHKYGMEVWAWESLFDDAGIRYDIEKCPPEYREFYRRNDGWPLLDPFYRKNMDALAMRDPRKALPQDKIDAINRDARKNPITRIVFTNRTPIGRRITITPKDFDIFTSSDNRTWKRVAKPFVFKPSVTPDGFNRFEITGISISDPYVKLAGKKPFKPGIWAVVINEQQGQGEIYDSTGRKVPSVWSWIEGGAGGRGSLAFDRFQAPAAWDFGNRQLGFVIGAAPMQNYYYGVAEFNVPKAMKHKVDRFVELAEDPFDGFIFNIRCHSRVANPEQYGYNPEVREIYLKRYGKDIWKDDVDVGKLFLIRAEAIADFFRNCKQHSGGRPIYLSGPRPLDGDPQGIGSQDYGAVFGPLPWLYKRYFADGSIDGVIMILRRADPDFASYFTPEITGGKPIKLGIFREMAQYPNNREAMQADLRKLKQRSDLDEIELYETLVLSKMPEIYDVIKE